MAAIQNASCLEKPWFLKKSFIILLLIGLHMRSSAQIDENTLKALFLEAAIRFINWPDSKAPSDKKTNEFVIGVFKTNQMTSIIKRVFSIKKIKNKSVVIMDIDSLDKIGICDMIFITENDKFIIKDVLRVCDSNNVLTVSDSPEFINSGIILSLFIDKNRIISYINEKNATISGFKISHHLLQKSIVVGNREN